jgi:hypothetical protein
MMISAKRLRNRHNLGMICIGAIGGGWKLEETAVVHSWLYVPCQPLYICTGADITFLSLSFATLFRPLPLRRRGVYSGDWHPRRDNKFVVGGGPQMAMYQWAPGKPKVHYLTTCSCKPCLRVVPGFDVTAALIHSLLNLDQYRDALISSGWRRPEFLAPS